jgi:hypothetical protein
MKYIEDPLATMAGSGAMAKTGGGATVPGDQEHNSDILDSM